MIKKSFLRGWAATVAFVCAAALSAPAAQAAPPPEDSFRGVWISTVYNLDYPAKATAGADSLREQADQILDNCAEMGLNAVMLQVRPSADALYPSAIFPWSVYLTGDQDTAPSEGFDPLAYWVDEAHARGMELHAWINPYRVTKKGDDEFASLSNENPAKQHPEWLVRHTDGNYYLNPGLPDVRALVADGVEEILHNYDVDGIHLDDYFYPGTDFDDDGAYQKYGSGFGSVGAWRRHNVDLLIQQLQSTVERSGKDVSFGISPAGVWANRSSLPEGSDTQGGETYFTHYADTRKWVKEEWIDYICPQIYWNIGHDKADYETLARWWNDVVDETQVKLYIGMADYRAGDADSSSPWHGLDEIRRQMKLNRSLSGVDGEIHFRYQFLMQVPGLSDFYKKEYA